MTAQPRKPLLPQTRVSARWPRGTAAPSALPTRDMALPAPSQAPTTAPVSAVAAPITHALPAQQVHLAPAVSTASTSANRNVLPARLLAAPPVTHVTSAPTAAQAVILLVQPPATPVIP